jgi:hypothetical protein
MTIMAEEMPQFRLFQTRSGAYYFRGWQKTTVGETNYELKLLIPTLYPDEMPKLYVTSPTALWQHGFRRMVNIEGTSHDFHTLENGPGGCVQICHFKTALWDASRTCVGVFAKGLLWLEAYEVHLRTGRSITDTLSQWKRRQQWAEKRTEFDELWKICLRATT